jgi:hypothetical protein
MDIKIYDDYLVGSAHIHRTFTDFLSKFKGQTGGVCCGPPVLFPGTNGIKYYTPQEDSQDAEVDLE